MLGALGGGLKAGITLYAIDRMSSAVNSAVSKSEAQMKRMQLQNEALNKSMLQTSQYLSMMKVGLAGMAVSGIAIGASVNQFASFQKGLAYISTLIDDVNFDVREKIGEDVLRIAGDTGKDVEDIMRGVYQAISTSIEPEKATQFIETVSKAAVAGNASIETSANAILTVLKSYGWETGRAMEASDKLFQTVKLGRVEFPQLSDAIAEFMQTGNLAKVSIDELLGAFAALTMVGVPINEASTSLNRFLLSIVDSSKESKEFAKSLGLDFSVERLRKVGILAFLDEIRAKVGTDITQIQKLFPEIRAFRAVAPLMDTARESFKKFSGEIKDSSGTTEKAMKKMEDTISFRVETIKQKLKGIGIKTGEAFAISLEGPITNIDKFLDNILKDEKKIERISAAIKIIFGASAILGTLSTIGWFTKSIGAIGAGFAAGYTGKALAGGGLMAGGAKTVGAVAGGIKSLYMGLGAAGPVGLMTLTTLTSLAYAKKKWGELTEWRIEKIKESARKEIAIQKEIDKVAERMRLLRKTAEDDFYRAQLTEYLDFLQNQKQGLQQYIQDLSRQMGYEDIGDALKKNQKDLLKWIKELPVEMAKELDYKVLIEKFRLMNEELTEAQKKELERESYKEEIKKLDEAIAKEFGSMPKTEKFFGYPGKIDLNITLEIPEGLGLPRKLGFNQRIVTETEKENQKLNIRLKSKGIPYPE